MLLTDVADGYCRKRYRAGMGTTFSIAAKCHYYCKVSLTFLDKKMKITKHNTVSFHIVCPHAGVRFDIGLILPNPNPIS